jgi:hypothetical protein
MIFQSMSECSRLNIFCSYFLGRLNGQLCVVWYLRAFRGGEEVGAYRKRRITRPCKATKADNKSEHANGQFRPVGGPWCGRAQIKPQRCQVTPAQAIIRALSGLQHLHSPHLHGQYELQPQFNTYLHYTGACPRRKLVQTTLASLNKSHACSSSLESCSDYFQRHHAP